MHLLKLRNMLGRASTVFASLSLHASVLASFAGGQASATRFETPVQVIELVDVPIEARAVALPDDAILPTLGHPHRHLYQVPASHDLHPHDPAVVHDRIRVAAPAPAAAALAAATPALVSPALAQDAVVLPQFTIALASNGPQAPALPSPGSTTRVADRAGLGEGAGSEDILPESGVSVGARLLSAAVAAYPPKARAEEVEADVALEIVVDSAGTVTEAKLLRGAGYGFDDAALTAVRRYRFTPAERAGRPVRVRMRWVVQFRLG